MNSKEIVEAVLCELGIDEPNKHDIQFATDFICDIDEVYSKAFHLIHAMMMRLERNKGHISPRDKVNRKRMEDAESIVYNTTKIMSELSDKLSKMASDALDFDEKNGINTYRKHKNMFL
jgi:hypothetical protein